MSRRDRPVEGPDDLTPTEQRVAHMLTIPMGHRQIARVLGVQRGTVARIVCDISERLPGAGGPASLRVALWWDRNVRRVGLPPASPR